MLPAASRTEAARSPRPCLSRVAHWAQLQQGTSLVALISSLTANVWVGDTLDHQDCTQIRAPTPL